MSDLTEIKAGLSKKSQVAFDYAMEVTRKHCKTGQSNLITQSRKKLITLLKKEAEFKSLIAQMTNQSATLTAPALVDGFKAWTVSLLSPEKAFEKMHNPKQ